MSLEHRETSGRDTSVARARVEDEGIEDIEDIKYKSIAIDYLCFYVPMLRKCTQICHIQCRPLEFSWRSGTKRRIQAEGGGAETLRRLVLSNENLGRSR